MRITAATLKPSVRTDSKLQLPKLVGILKAPGILYEYSPHETIREIQNDPEVPPRKPTS